MILASETTRKVFDSPDTLNGSKLMQSKSLMGILAAGLLMSANSASAVMQITEWQYNTSEFIEFTNIGASPVNMAGWSFDDDSRAAGTVDLSGFGMVAPYESVILSEASASDFRTTWGLPASVKVIGGNSANLGRNDEINLFDASSSLVDRLTYGDQNIPGTIRTETNSGNPMNLAALGANDVSKWVFSSAGDTYGSHLNSASPAGYGNPGVFSLVPEPSTALMVVFGAIGAVCRRRRRTS
jgi:predicted extracellular nuclease